jgi:AcrR family transcriptional regulator
MSRDPEATKQLIIEKSALIFNRKGYAGTTLQDLTKAIGMTKGSIYGNFENKNQVSLEAFKYNFKELTKRITSYVSKEPTAIGQLLALTKFYREDFDVMTYLGGCPVMNAATDADDTNDHLRSEVSKAFDVILGTIGGIIEGGKKTREIWENVESAKYAVLFFSLIEGGILMSKTTGKKQFLFETCDRIDQIINEELRQ